MGILEINRKGGTRLEKNLTINNPKEDEDQDLASKTDGDKRKQSSEHMRLSKSSISESERLRRKLKFQEKGRANPRIKDMGIFLSVTILNSLGYWKPKGWSPTTSLPKSEFFSHLLPQIEYTRKNPERLVQ